MGLLSMCTETTIPAQSPKPRLTDSRAAAGTWPVTARINRDVASRAQRGRGAASASKICCSAEPHFHLSSAASPQRAGCSMQCSRERPGAGTPSVGLLQRPRYVMLPRLWPP